MSLDVSVSRDADALSGSAKLLVETVKNEQDEPSLNNDYPYVYVVEQDGETCIAFVSNLPESREPWSIGEFEFERDDVFKVADGIGQMTSVSPSQAYAVRSAAMAYHQATQ